MKNKNLMMEHILTAEKCLEYILGVTNTGLDIIDSNFNIVYIDPEWAKIYGKTEGKKCYEYFMGRSKVCPGCGVKKALNTKKPAVTEEVLAKEKNRPIQVTTIPFQNKKGEWFVAEVNVDITKRKKMEKRLRDKIRDLEIFKRATSERELNIIELKKMIKKLMVKLSQREIMANEQIPTFKKAKIIDISKPK